MLHSKCDFRYAVLCEQTFRELLPHLKTAARSKEQLTLSFNFPEKSVHECAFKINGEWSIAVVNKKDGTRGTNATDMIATPAPYAAGVPRRVIVPDVKQMMEAVFYADLRIRKPAARELPTFPFMFISVLCRHYDGQYKIKTDSVLYVGGNLWPVVGHRGYRGIASDIADRLIEIVRTDDLAQRKALEEQRDMAYVAFETTCP